MKKIALFVEGKSELIFVKELLLKISNYSKIKIDCFKVLTDNNFTNDDSSYSSSPVKVEVLLINVGGDQKVVSAIRSRAKGLLAQGFTTIWGLRDMYSEEYDRRSGGKIDNAITNKVIMSVSNIFCSDGLSRNVKVFFSVMELEAWFLGFFNALKALGFSVDAIKKIIGKDVTTIDPETEFFKPKTTLSCICKAIWKKNYDEAGFAHKISAQIQLKEMKDLAKSGRISHFRIFFEDMANHLKVCN